MTHGALVHSRLLPPLALGLALVLAPTARTAPLDDEPLTIYRCTDSGGHLSLRDTPCERGERQEAKAMQRPRDPPFQPAPAMVPPATPPAAIPSVPAPVATRPRGPYLPVYRCTTEDGQEYTSNTPDGNPRWVPLWTLGYPVMGGPGYHGWHPSPPVRPAHHGHYGGTAVAPPRAEQSGFMFDSVGRPSPAPPRNQPGVPDRLPIGGRVQGPGTWIRDACIRISHAEMCADLRNRRTALGRRYNSALQSERQQIDREKVLIDEQLGSECGP